mgnify:CR=1 FL=1
MVAPNPATVLDLDGLMRPPLKIKIGGAEHALAPNDLTTLREFQVMADAASSAEGIGRLDALEKQVRFLAPSLTTLTIGKLTGDQCAAIIRAWAEQSVAFANQDAAETKAVVEDPMLPG